MPNPIFSLNRASQLGVQEETGEPVAATRKLNAMAFPMNAQQAVENFRPPGAKYDTGEAITREWSEGSVGDGSGFAYNEIAFVFAQVHSVPVVRTLGSVVVPRSTALKVGEYYRPAAGVHIYKVTTAGTTAGAEPTAAYAAATDEGDTVTDGTAILTEAGAHPSPAIEMLFDTATWSYDEVPLYTIETFDRNGGRGHRARDCFFTGGTINSIRTGAVAVTGSLLGGAVDDQSMGFIPTPAEDVEEDELIPGTPADLNVYMDESHEQLGATLLDGNFRGQYGITDKASQYFWHNRATRGPSGRGESPPEATAELVQADGEEVDDMVAALRRGEKRFFRYEFKGPEIAPGINHLCEIDFAGMVRDNVEFDDEQTIWAATVPLAVTHSGDWGRAAKARIVSTLTELG